MERNFLKTIPTPIAGLMLGLAACGNVLALRDFRLKYVFGIISVIILLLLILKSITNFKILKEEFNNVAIASVMPTFSMGVMVLSTYVVKMHYGLSATMWYFGYALHVFFIIAFTIKYVKNIKTQIMPSWYIVYVGIVCATVSAKPFNLFLGEIAFYFGFITYILLIPFVIYKVYVKKDLKRPALPSKMIMTAPGSLCLAGYLAGMPNKNHAMIVFLIVLSQIFFVLVLREFVRHIRNEFYPSCSAYTFPFAITALSIKLFKGYMLKRGVSSILLNGVAVFEEVLAVVLCIYILILFIKFIYEKNKKVVG